MLRFDQPDGLYHLISLCSACQPDRLAKRFNRMTFVVSTKQSGQNPHCVKVTDVFKTDSDRASLKRPIVGRPIAQIRADI
ncbi:protein of unknown function [Nitrospira japonica]|uniref:Uncharacterized protein n=1 Tax=Nitrospira japonica TaxID=1325564 RepID=A0A1W1IAB0_9BACT|nr:protein of unknown function [Nitrospira japonica]